MHNPALKERPMKNVDRTNAQALQLYQTIYKNKDALRICARRLAKAGFGYADETFR